MTPTATVETITRAQAELERRRILEQIGHEDDFRERAAEYLLDDNDQALFARLTALDYLLR